MTSFKCLFIRAGDQPQVPGSSLVQGRHPLTRQKQHQDCFSNGSDGQMKQGLAEQHHLLRTKIHCTRLLPSPSHSLAVRHGGLCLLTEKGIQALTSLHLLLRAQDHRLGAVQDKLPCGPTGTASVKETRSRLIRIIHASGQPF